MDQMGTEEFHRSPEGTESGPGKTKRHGFVPLHTKPRACVCTVDEVTGKRHQPKGPNHYRKQLAACKERVIRSLRVTYKAQPKII